MLGLARDMRQMSAFFPPGGMHICLIVIIGSGFTRVQSFAH
jgi:hypothetical protein